MELLAGIATDKVCSKVAEFTVSVLEGVLSDIISDSLIKVFQNNEKKILNNINTVLYNQQTIIDELRSIRVDMEWNVLMAQVQNSLSVIQYYYGILGKVKPNKMAQLCQIILQTNPHGVHFALTNLDRLLSGNVMGSKPLVAAFGEKESGKYGKTAYYNSMRLWRDLLSVEVCGYAMLIASAEYLKEYDSVDTFICELVQKIKNQEELTRESIHDLSILLINSPSTKKTHISYIDTRFLQTDINHVVVGIQFRIRPVNRNRLFGSTQMVLSLDILQAELNEQGEVRPETVKVKRCPNAIGAQCITKVDRILKEHISADRMKKFVTGVGLLVETALNTKLARLSVQFAGLSPSFHVIEVDRATIPGRLLSDPVTAVKCSVSPVIDTEPLVTKPYHIVNAVGINLDKNNTVRFCLQFNAWLEKSISEQRLKNCIEKLVNSFKIPPASVLPTIPSYSNTAINSNKIRILVCGSCGSGKSSVTRVLTNSGMKMNHDEYYVPPVFNTETHLFHKDKTSYEIVEVTGIDGSMNNNPTSAMRSLILFLSLCKQGFNMMIYTHKDRIFEIDVQNFKLFSNILPNVVPRIAAVTHLENVTDTKRWIDQNYELYARSGMQFDAVVGGCFCFEEGRLESFYQQKREEAKHDVWETISKYCWNDCEPLRTPIGVLQDSWNRYINYLVKVLEHNQADNWRWNDSETAQKTLQSIGLMREETQNLLLLLQQ
jgi:hypothetical protein